MDENELRLNLLIELETKLTELFGSTCGIMCHRCGKLCKHIEHFEGHLMLRHILREVPTED